MGVKESSEVRRPLWKRLLTNWVVLDPNLVEHDDSRQYKNYEALQHKNHNQIYLFGGRWRATKARPINVICLALMLIAGILFFIFEASWLWHNVSPAIVIIFSYLWFVSVMLFIKAATSDPGILPRNVHFPTEDKDLESPDEYFTIITVPYIRSDNNGVMVRYCTTCHLWRPARSSHCRVCNVCVADHDHHCIYINNCVGLRNQKYFLWFLLIACTTCTIAIICCFVHLFHYRLVDTPGITRFRESISKYPMSLFLALYTLLLIIYPGLIFVLHVILTAQNLTTREYLNRNSFEKKFINVFDTKSIAKNLYINWIGKSRGVSTIRYRDPYSPGDIRMEDVPPYQ